MVNLEIVGIKETGGATIQTASYAVENPFESFMAEVLIGANLGAVAAVPVKDFTYEYDSGVELIQQNSSANGRYASCISWGKPVINVSFNKLVEDDFNTIYDYFKNDTENAVQLKLTHPELAGSASGFHALTINLPRVFWLGDTPGIDNQDELTMAMRLQAIKEIVSYNYTQEVVVTNSEAGVYTV
jgi:hypothetical protein